MSVRSQCLHAISSEPQGTMIAPVAFWMTLSVNAVKRTALCRICFSCLIPTTSASPPLGLPFLFINPNSSLLMEVSKSDSQPLELREVDILILLHSGWKVTSVVVLICGPHVQDHFHPIWICDREV
jgi:hypothetical protein